MKRLAVIIPSRAQAKQEAFLARAVASVRNQVTARAFQIELLVGVDQGAPLAPAVCERLGITCVESEGRSQAGALNAAIRRLEADFVAFLEDDDEWLPEYLGYAAKAAERADFVSSTQSELDETGLFLRINDFPTPSGWFMPVATLRKVGEFDESFRYRLDNEWLGRLSESGARRVHLVEATAPVDMKYLPYTRPLLANVVGLSGGRCRLGRHPSPYPLVRRLVHSGSGTSRIEASEAMTRISQQEYQALQRRFGRIPW